MSNSSSSSTNIRHCRLRDDGSTVGQASLNFTNSIVGAASVGFGGAIAQSGGFLAVSMIVLFGTLAKVSCDLVIWLGTTFSSAAARGRTNSAEAAGREGTRMRNSASTTADSSSSCLSYESLGLVPCGRTGLVAVTVSKFLFCFGCLVAYIVIVKENFAPACRHLIPLRFVQQHRNDNIAALILSIVVVLPLSLMRDLTPLSKFSALKIVAYAGILGIVTYLYFQLPWTTSEDDDESSTRTSQQDDDDDTFANHWLQIKPSFIPNMGTFVMAFITQHTINIVYDSLQQQDLATWKQVSSISILLAMTVMMSLGLVVYMTFWEQTQSDMFVLYPPSFVSVDVARILLCITIMLTYPMPFYASRELIIVSLLLSPSSSLQQHDNNNIGEPQHSDEYKDNLKVETEEDALLLSSPNTETNDSHSGWLIPGEDHQLKGPYHVLVTVVIWASSVGLALGAPSLGDVLNVVGCIAGSLIGFLLPALFSYQLQGKPTVLASVLFVTGIFVGCIGTYYSIVNLVKDTTST